MLAELATMGVLLGVPLLIAGAVLVCTRPRPCLLCRRHGRHRQDAR